MPLFETRMCFVVPSNDEPRPWAPDKSSNCDLAIVKFAVWFAEVDKSDDGNISRSELFDHLLVEIDQQLGGVINIKNLELRESMKHQGPFLMQSPSEIVLYFGPEQFESLVKSRESCEKGRSKSRQRWR